MDLDTSAAGNAGPLFQPFRLKGLTLRNRFVMAPMTRAHSPGNVPGEQNVAYYARRAAAGVGLIVSEGTLVDRPGNLHMRDIPRFYGENALAGWANVARAVHEAGGAMAPQLWHVGPAPSASAGERPPNLEGPATMTREDVRATVRAFAEAAADAKRVGFDAIEIHGAHGYLVDSFFDETTNARTDEYGGRTIGERSRFAVEVVEAVRDAVGPEAVVILRVSQWRIGAYDRKLARDPAEMGEWLLPLAAAGVDVFHMSQRRYWEPEFAGSDLNAAGWAKKITGKPTITVGSVGLSSELNPRGPAAEPRGLDELVRRFERGDFDLVAVGRSLLVDPGWVEKIRLGRAAELQSITRESLSHYF